MSAFCMENGTPDTIINELFNSLDFKVPRVPESDSASACSMAESIKKHKRHEKSKKHKKHKKKSKKSKKSVRRSRSNSSNDFIVLNLRKDKLEEAETGMPVTLDVVMDTIVSTANEKSKETEDNKCDDNENSQEENTLTHEHLVKTSVNDIYKSKLNNGKIFIKDLKDSQLYQELINTIHESDEEHSCSPREIDKKKVKHNKFKKKKRSRSRNRFNTPRRQKKRKRSLSRSIRDRSTSRSRNRSSTPIRQKKHKRSLSRSSRDRSRSRSRNRSSTPIRQKKRNRSLSRSSRDRSRSRSRNGSSTPIRQKKRKRSLSRSSRDRYSRYDDFKKRSISRDRNRYKDRDTKSKEKYDYYKRSITPVREHRRSRSKDNKRPKRLDEIDKTKNRSRSREISNYRRYTSPSCEKIDKKKLFKIARKNALSLVQQGILPVGSVKKENLANVPTKTVDELTDFCRKLSKKEKEHNDDSLSSSDEEFKQPFHHPFLVKERPNIVMNIRNATQLPTKSFQEKTIGQDVLRQQFPVSSGQIHSLAVNEWVPLGPEESAKLNKTSRSDEGNKLSGKPIVQQVPKVVPVEPVIIISEPSNDVVSMEYQYSSPVMESPTTALDNYSLLSYETGQFTGHTGAKILTPAELSAGYQPWVKKDQLKNTAPVNSGIGIHLLQKMGWKPGECLGKNQTGSLEPLLLDVKMDKRGLVAEEEIHVHKGTKKISKKSGSSLVSLEGKHPVSLLNEFCAKHKWDIPKFNTVEESGPSHRKSFVMTVIVNGKQYSSAKCQTKKLAKMEAAKICLREIGFIKTNTNEII